MHLIIFAKFYTNVVNFAFQMSDTGLTESVKDNPCKFEVWVQGRNEVHLLQVSHKICSMELRAPIMDSHRNTICIP